MSIFKAYGSLSSFIKSTTLSLGLCALVSVKAFAVEQIVDQCSYKDPLSNVGAIGAKFQSDRSKSTDKLCKDLKEQAIGFVAAAKVYSEVLSKGSGSNVGSSKKLATESYESMKQNAVQSGLSSDEASKLVNNQISLVAANLHFENPKAFAVPGSLAEVISAIGQNPTGVEYTPDYAKSLDDQAAAMAVALKKQMTPGYYDLLAFSASNYLACNIDIYNAAKAESKRPGGRSMEKFAEDHYKAFAEKENRPRSCTNGGGPSFSLYDDAKAQSYLKCNPDVKAAAEKEGVPEIMYAKLHFVTFVLKGTEKNRKIECEAAKSDAGSSSTGAAQK